MSERKNRLKDAINFHGHLGPWLVLGLLAGEFALRQLKAKKHFGIKVTVWGATRKPRSCLIDGLQLSTGATYGKGNIEKLNGNKIQILFCNLKNNKKIKIYLKESLIKKLDTLKGHKDSEDFAKSLYKVNHFNFFDLTTNY